MTLKELRKSKGLNQAECAAFLGMSTRNYQNYENDASKADTARYHAIYRKLESYDQPVATMATFAVPVDSAAAKAAMASGVSAVPMAAVAPADSANPATSVAYVPTAISVISDSASPTSTSHLPSAHMPEFYTNVITGMGLRALISSVKKYGKRDCFGTLQKFVTGSYDGKICILYGLRRTGKTTLLFQMISQLPIEQSAYIKVQTTDDMSRLTKDLKALFELGYRYVFIDEITLLRDFIDTAAVLSDVFSMMGMKIIVSGTDSLGFAMAGRDELYDRSVMIHTSFIPFREYARLLDIHSVDTYIEYGGTLKMENMSFGDPDASFDEAAFRDDESTRKYIDTAISRNIQHTLKNDHNGKYFNQLRELYEKGELTDVINRIVQHMNHRFVLRVVEEAFKSHDFGSAREMLLHDLPAERATVLYEVDEKKILERLKAIIEVKEKGERTVQITQEHIDKVKKYLFMLDLIVDCPERYESGRQAEHIIFSQPGMRCAIAKALVYSLMQDDYFATLSEPDKTYIIGKLLDDVKGRMLEDIVLVQVCKADPRNTEAFKFKFDAGGEFDMVIYDKASQNCRIYEIKHSTRINEKQTIHLRDTARCRIVEKRFGPISCKYVLYRGKDASVDGIHYLNVEDFLCGLK